MSYNSPDIQNLSNEIQSIKDQMVLANNFYFMDTKNSVQNYLLLDSRVEKMEIIMDRILNNQYEMKSYLTKLQNLLKNNKKEEILFC